MAGIPDHIIDQVRERTDIVEIISRYVRLKKAGRNYKAPCPFHSEKTPSFMVSPAKQIYHCFGCGAGGNVFSFLMKYERLEFPEAVRELAKKAGVTMPASSTRDSRNNSMSEMLHAVNEKAAAFFRKALAVTDGKAVSKQYLANRKIGQGMVEEFKLGYAPKLWSGLLDHLKREGYDEPILEKAGLIIKGRNGNYFDRFRDKIIFPIHDTKGRVKGFGSRVLDNTQPKYMNSPETFIYNKRNHLYGLNLSWEEIRDKNAAVVVEGYLDMLTPFQHGVKNVVASLGTALTVEQIRLLKRYTNNIIVLFDSDQAGENAAVRSLDLLLQEDMKVRVAQLPKGEDPDSFISKFGPVRFRETLDKALDLFDYRLKLLLSKYDCKGLEGKARIASEILPLISKIKNAIVQSGYLKKLSETLLVSEADLRRELKKVKPDYTYQYQAPAPKVKRESASMAERIIAGLMLEDELFIELVKDGLGPGDFKDARIRKIVERLFKEHNTSKKIDASKMVDHFKDEQEICACIAELTATCESLVDKRKSLEDCIQWIRQGTLKERLKSLCEEIRLAQDEGDDSKIVDLVTRYNDMMKHASV